jgi:hypothetical protein
VTKTVDKRRAEMKKARTEFEGLTNGEKTRLTLRFMNECPPLSEQYVKRECPDVLPKAQTYNAKRRIAASDADINALAELRVEIEELAQ